MHTDPTGNYTKINIHTTANIQQYSINATNVQTIHAKIIYKRSRMPIKSICRRENFAA